jgi:16S rRNA processing protein RimM
MKKLEKPVQMAVIGAPHGVRGEVRVKTFTGDPQALGDYGPLVTEDGRTFTVASIRPAKNVMVVRFKEITSREAAEAVTGISLFVDRSALPDDLDEEEFYHADLVGLEIRDETGATVGKVTSIQNFGGGDILVATISRRRDVMIPFTLAAIPQVSVSEGFIRIDTASAGLIDEEEDEEEGGAE